MNWEIFWFVWAIMLATCIIVMLFSGLILLLESCHYDLPAWAIAVLMVVLVGLALSIGLGVFL
jgi:hypothetical protein